MEYTNENRGIIQFPERARQINNFGNIRVRNITPTDIDGCMELRKENAFIFFEVKYNGAELPKGQKSALEEMVKCLRKQGKEAVLLVCRHDVKDPRDDVDVSNSIVNEYYCGVWYRLRKGMICKDVIDEFMRYLWKRQGELQTCQENIPQTKSG